MGTSHEDYYIHFGSYLTQLLLEWEMFQTKVVEKIKTHILCSVTYFLTPCCVWDNLEKYSRAGEATDDNMGHAHLTLGIETYKYTFVICHTLIFHCNNGYTNAPRYYVVCLWHVAFNEWGIAYSSRRKVCKSVHYHTIQINHPLDATVSSVLLSWRLFTAQHVSGVLMPVIRSSTTAVAASSFTFVSWW
jgi:hypothetical protein